MEKFIHTDFLCHFRCPLLSIVLFSLHDPITVFTTRNKAPAFHITAKHWCFLWSLMLSERLPLLFNFQDYVISGIRQMIHKETSLIVHSIFLSFSIYYPIFLFLFLDNPMFLYNFPLHTH